ncbi:MAG: GAF domain-containing protein [Candidatus Promineifilaceae bacterium]
MKSPYVVFTGYAIIGLTLLILSASVATYLLRLPSKSRATWALIAFFFLVALSGAATILTNSVFGWLDFFAPWQDLFILAGGVALSYFAYNLPRYEPSLEARAVLLLMSVLAFAALLYTISFDYRFLFHWSPELNESDLYYLLLPLEILFVVIIFLRRSVQFSRRAAANTNEFEAGSSWRFLIYPQDEEAEVLRNFALALSLAFLPGLQTVASFPSPYSFILSNIGSILAIIAIALVYFNYAPEVNSFMAKLVGITLATVLLIVAVAGSVDVFFAGRMINDIGISGAASAYYLSGIVSRWLLLILVVSVFILLVFPLFFRRILVRPLDNLLGGIQRVNRGDLNTFVPKQFDDEIGSLTDSFNRLTQSLKLSQSQQEELFDRLQTSYAELEERVSDRTRELSAFTDLTMLPSADEELADMLQPALNRIMDINLCEALCIHLLNEDETSMELVAYRNLPDPLVEGLQFIPSSASFIGRIQHNAEPLMTGEQNGCSDLPDELKIPQFQSYLGSPLVAGDQIHGWLSCYRQKEKAFSLGEISLLVALARQMGLIVENQRLRRHIKNIAAVEERRRLARDLHDSVTQLVYSMTLFTRSSQEALQDGDQERLAANLAHLASTSLLALREMRYMLFELQPPVLEAGGLAGAINARLDMVERRVGISAETTVDTTIGSAELERDLYYVAIEALNNSLKHAHADAVSLKITRENGCIRLCIVDNGRGFDLASFPAGMGINNMRKRVENRGGDLRISSSINGGTSIAATIPVTQ